MTIMQTRYFIVCDWCTAYITPQPMQDPKTSKGRLRHGLMLADPPAAGEAATNAGWTKIPFTENGKPQTHHLCPRCLTDAWQEARP